MFRTMLGERSRTYARIMGRSTAAFRSNSRPSMGTTSLLSVPPPRPLACFLVWCGPGDNNGDNAAISLAAATTGGACL